MMLLQEKERKEGPLEKGWTENCCAIEVWISKETGELGEGGRSTKPVRLFAFAAHCTLFSIALASLHLLFH